LNRPALSRKYAHGQNDVISAVLGERIVVRTVSAALLPIKAHSARVPSKNFRSFAGKPLYRWILDTLLSMTEIELIVINTDARAFLERSGLECRDRVLIRDRPENLRGDHVSMNRIIADDLGAVDASIYLMTHTTNPLLRAETIRSARAAFDAATAAGTADSLFAVRRHQTRFYRADGSAVNHDPRDLIRTQDLEPWFEENSNLYIFTRDSFRASRARIGARPVLFEVPKSESFDIDTMEDWRIAEALASAWRSDRNRYNF
jgi:CMP-N-acetylneuraminic acid synthetase